MSESAWLPIQYREFYDFPRAIILERGKDLFVLDDPFDDEADEYADYFLVYSLSERMQSDVTELAWEEIIGEAELIGRVRTADVHFDSSRRAFVREDLFRRIEPA